MRQKNRISLRKSLVITAVMVAVSVYVFAGSYTVRSGDTLWIIANKHGTSLETLRKLNPVVEPCHTGQVITCLLCSGWQYSRSKWETPSGNCFQIRHTVNS